MILGLFALIFVCAPPRSLLGLIILVAVLTVVSVAAMHGTVASLREPELGKLHFLTDIMIPNREECWHTGHVHADSSSEIRAL